MKYIPYAYQKYCIDLVKKNEKRILFLDMGLGKTVIALTVIQELIDEQKIKNALIVAPKRVCESVWRQEAEKWDHTKNLRFSFIAGTPKERAEAARVDADIYLISRDNLAKLAHDMESEDGRTFDFLVIDELSNFKNPSSVRFRTLKKWRPKFKRFLGLTGTPAPQSVHDLWSQVWLADAGRALGKTLTNFREKYFTKRSIGFTGVVVYEPKKIALDEINERIKSVCISMRAKDYISLPPVIYKKIEIEHDAIGAKLYKKMARDYVLPFQKEVVTANNAAVLAGKLQQLNSGLVYSDDGKIVDTGSTAKRDAFLETAEALLASNFRTLIFYMFRSELAVILDALKKIGAKAQALQSDEEVRSWNERRLDFLVAHPASCGYGLNLQYGGNSILWYTLPWSLEQFLQAKARLIRQGQKEKVLMSCIIVKKTIDDTILSVLREKKKIQDIIKDAVRAVL